MSIQTNCTILQPRPYANCSGKLLLLPLLSSKRTFDLPNELWIHVFELGAEGREATRFLRSLLTVSKRFKDIVLPLFYSSARISTLPNLYSFWDHLHTADTKWDSIRRSPYSAPGRWVQRLDLSNLPFTSQSAALEFDGILTKLFPLLPFLSSLKMNPSFILSRRAIGALIDSTLGTAGVLMLRKLEGLSYVPQTHAFQYISGGVSQVQPEEPLVQLLRHCPYLEELEVIGRGLDSTELDFLNSAAFEEQQSQQSTPISNIFNLLDSSTLGITPIHLPALRTLTLLSHLHSSALALTLLISPLPSLKKLTITPYDDVPFPYSLNSQFILVHGTNLSSLSLLTPNSNEWPRRVHRSPSLRTILTACPNLRHLGLESPLPEIQIPLLPSVPSESQKQTHPLEILTLPRPTHTSFTLLRTVLPTTPNLRAVRARDVRWLRKGMGLRAMEAGVQGEMREWRRKLARRGVRVVDGEWKDAEE
ncbi:hypothetical protein K435DRAFT_743761 [Dendrothele bispora CBS 962.96]|uniref:F-box domain-containing protein n=1 Tax=Dendrothele bispora (strain CBS 962.96) TaxID=1314807 RepID=A0A4S8MVY9_DENBC|nr:hypothetical protein K435DRAFT_743761 [Dendrothele bispora CBS 962.96]